MTRIRLVGRWSARTSSRRSLRRALLLGAWLVLWTASGVAAAPVRVAVAPFADDPPDVGSELGRQVADSIASQLRTRPLDRLIAPGAFLARASFDPPAEEIRRWAYNAAVEAVVVGRVVQGLPGADASRQGHRIEIVLRSGHSGAELARHAVRVDSRGGLAGASAQLAEAILADLDYSDPAPIGDLALHTVGFVAPIVAADGARQGSVDSSTGTGRSGRGLDTDFDSGGFDSTAPIEIKAEEAEIVGREGGRNLVFQRNVFVRQANVTLRSDHLEATYRKGESEPDRLVARGRVLVDQGDRRARCDRAVYERASKQLTCTGHAELVQGCDIVRGQSIEFHLGEDRARVEGAASIVIQPDGETVTACPSSRGVM